MRVAVHLSVGINTDIFPGNSVVSPLGDTFVVDAITSIW